MRLNLCCAYVSIHALIDSWYVLENIRNPIVGEMRYPVKGIPFLRYLYPM